MGSFGLESGEAPTVLWESLADNPRTLAQDFVCTDEEIVVWFADIARRRGKAPVCA